MKKLILCLLSIIVVLGSADIVGSDRREKKPKRKRSLRRRSPNRARRLGLLHRRRSIDTDDESEGEKVIVEVVQEHVVDDVTADLEALERGDLSDYESVEVDDDYNEDGLEDEIVVSMGDVLGERDQARLRRFLGKKVFASGATSGRAEQFKASAAIMLHRAKAPTKAGNDDSLSDITDRVMAKLKGDFGLSRLAGQAASSDLVSGLKDVVADSAESAISGLASEGVRHLERAVGDDEADFLSSIVGRLASELSDVASGDSSDVSDRLTAKLRGALPEILKGVEGRVQERLKGELPEALEQLEAKVRSQFDTKLGDSKAALGDLVSMLLRESETQENGKKCSIKAVAILLVTNVVVPIVVGVATWGLDKLDSLLFPSSNSTVSHLKWE